MARYRVVERRCYDVEYVVEAESAEAAGRLRGDIISEDGDAGDSWVHDLLWVEEIDEDEEQP